jgi:predicted ATPase
MKVYFSGCHGSGKSTLARFVSNKYKLPMINETARAILSEQELQIDALRGDLEVADKYQHQVFDRQVLEEQKYSSFVSDRSVIDILSYSAQHTRILPQLINSPALVSHISILKEPDSILFFVKPTIATMRPDGVREILTWDGAVAIDAMIKVFLQMWEIKHYIINTDNMQERIQLITTVLP